MRCDAVGEARSWLGTPYLHQASVKGHGADCLGLIRGVWRALNGDEPTQIPPYSNDRSEAERDERLWDAACTHLCPVERAPLIGDVLLFRMRHGMVAKHLGIVSELGAAPKFIHAYQGHGVVESPFSRPWRRRVVASFEFP